ncbi:MAG: polysaccharide deacetylase family protein [Thermoleophilia bacterium]|nr:polysaccharide deacetylase family protein [Thermoleophilia bacterium]
MRTGPVGHHWAVPSQRPHSGRPSRDGHDPPRNERRRRTTWRVPPVLLTIVGVVVVALMVALAIRNAREPMTESAGPSVDPAATTAQQLGPRDQELVDIGQTGVSVHRAGGARNVVALTFDDGPGPDTPAVLSILKRAGVPATFFVVGGNVTDSPSLVQQAVTDGHQIGIHTYTHADLTKLPAARQKQEIDTTATAIINASGVASRLFRAPYGAINPSVIRAATTARLLSVLWNVDTSDWSQPTADQITRTVLAQAIPGAIILMHDGGGNRGATVQALPGIITALRARGFEFATVGDLVVSDPPGSDDVSVDGQGVSE